MKSICPIVVLSLLYYFIDSTISVSNCSATSSYVQVSITSGTTTQSSTVTSAQAHFEPYSYYVPETELVKYSDSDHPCDDAGVSTDLASKIVLLFSNTASCSDHSQVLVAQILGAKAVLMVSQDSDVNIIISDDSSLTTSIPMRGISLDLGVRLRSNLTAGNTIQVEFGCPSSSVYPTEICILDTNGENWWLDGDYTRQFKESGNEVTKNNHPVWVHEGYTFFTFDEYLFMDVSRDGESGWFWTITEDASMRNPNLILAQCYDANIELPSDCSSWWTSSYNFYGDGELGSDAYLSQSNNIELTDGICTVPDSYLCIQSEQSSLAGLSGTYRLYNDNIPYWFREWDECDNTPGWLVFFDGYFYLVDPMDGWITAYCYWGSSWSDSNEYRPDLCEEWYSIVDGSLDYYNLKNDSTLTISHSECDVTPSCATDYTPPDTLCLSKNTIAHSFMEGNYIFTGEYGSTYSTKEYIRDERLFYDGEAVDVYLYYFAEISLKYDWWILASHNLSVGDAQNYSMVYGYLPCSMENPTLCNANWNFYWVGSEDAIYADWHQDPYFEVTEDECEYVSTEEYQYGDDYDYICLDVKIEFEDQTYLEVEDFAGAYRKNGTTPTALSGYTPYWYKPSNKNTNIETYLYYDEFFGYWQIGYSLHDETMLLCMTDTRYPENCDQWYDEWSADLSKIISIRVEDCSEADYLTIEAKDSISGWTVVGVIVAVLILLAICLFCAYYTKEMRGEKKGRAEFVSSKDIPTNKNNNNNTSNAEVELADDQGTKGGFDMSPLNPNVNDGPVDTVDHNVDEDVDEPNKDVLDNEDDGLMNTTAGDNEPDVPDDDGSTSLSR